MHRLTRCWPLVAQVDAAVHGLGHKVAHDSPGQFGQVQLRAAHHLARVLGPRHGQQLVDHVGRSLAGQRNLRKAVLHRLWVPTAAVDLARGQLGLHAQAGQRRLELVRRIGQKVALRGDGLVQPFEQVVDGLHQRRHFIGHTSHRNGAEVRAGAAPDALLQFSQRPYTPGQGKPDQQDGQRQDHKLGQKHALDDFGGQLRAPVQCLGNLHQRFAMAVSSRQQQVGHANRVVEHHVVPELHA